MEASFQEKAGHSNMGILVVDQTDTIISIHPSGNRIRGISDALNGHEYYKTTCFMI